MFYSDIWSILSCQAVPDRLSSSSFVFHSEVVLKYHTQFHCAYIYVIFVHKARHPLHVDELKLCNLKQYEKSYEYVSISNVIAIQIE